MMKSQRRSLDLGIFGKLTAACGVTIEVFIASLQFLMQIAAAGL